jgi:hypothetical protein
MHHAPQEFECPVSSHALGSPLSQLSRFYPSRDEHFNLLMSRPILVDLNVQLHIQIIGQHPIYLPLQPIQRPPRKKRRHRG